MKKALVTLIAALAALAAFASTAAAALQFESNGFTVRSVDAGGAPDNQAGSHPSGFVTEFELKTAEDGRVTNYFKDVFTELPPGFVGNPEAAPTCSRSVFVELIMDPGVAERCPVNSQVGIAWITLRTFGAPELYPTPVFLLDPPAGSVAQLGLPIITVPVTLDVKVDTGGDYAINVDSLNTSQGLPVSAVKVEIWGVPGDPVHDQYRTCGTNVVSEPCAAEGEARPFFTNPVRCGAALESRLRLDSWEEIGQFVEARHDGEPLSGCEEVSFDAQMDLRTGRGTGEPSGISVDLEVPQGDDPGTGLARGIMRTVKLTLPEGFAISASSANQLGACDDSQLGLKSIRPITCPDSSKLGTVVAHTPLLDHPVQGDVYLRTQGSADPQSGEMFRLAMVLSDPERGLLIKLPGQVRVNPATGQIETTFADNPQLPVSKVSLSLKSGPRAPLVTPKRCGSYVATYSILAWSGQVIDRSVPIAVDQNCGPRGFAPSLSAGSLNPVGGINTPFTFQLSRQDGQQDLAGLSVSLPKGLLAKLAGVPVCPDGLATTGACPLDSRVGSAVVGAGVGLAPVFVPEPGKAPGSVYLAGPYKGAPYSLVVNVRAQAGPFDLGTVPVRNALHVDPRTAQVTVESDPLPQIVKGVPIDYREIRVRVDRPGFLLNPTGCTASSVEADVTSDEGARVRTASRFQVAGCERLGFSPKLKMSLYGAPPRRGGFPALKATLTAPKGQANIGKASVLLPGTELLEQNHIRTICTRDQWASDTCPKAAIYGKAKAWTPLLDKPLEGPVYLRANGGARELPDLVADLRGQIEIELAGYIDTVKRNGVPRMRTRFVNVPDAAVTKFVLQMQGGRKGLLANNTNLCKAKPRAGVQFDGQNGKVHDINPLVAVSGCGKKGK